VSFEIRAFQTSKTGSKPEDCEDALSFDPQRRLFAIADGATDSAFQRLWAGLLVKGFINHPPDFSRPSSVKEWFGGWIKNQQEQWNKNIQWDKLSWSGHNKAKITGGLATFLGIYFFPNKPIWQSIAFGDCDLFQLREQKTRDYYLYGWSPITDSRDFGTNPIALSSIYPDREKIYQHMIPNIGDYEEGDIFFLATDALAAWFLTEYEKRIVQNMKNTGLEWLTSRFFPNLFNGNQQLGVVHNPWEILLNLKTKNDDTSLIIIEITRAPDKASIKKNRDSQGVLHATITNG
jgi:hypothetical protein